MANPFDESDPFNRLPKPPRPNDHTNTIAPPESDAGLAENPWVRDEPASPREQRGEGD